MRTLVIDARLQVQSTRADGADALGRELRRALVVAQAARLADPPSEEFEVIALVDEAANAIEAQVDPVPWKHLLDAARAARDAAHRRISQEGSDIE
jgi:hypothetical protein